ncbi:MAG: SMP-30/gluconolactonase/LRE family protein [Kiritimatiellae bacterium]|nr:SMP-30/gluconolactonase/LRE family protein [Kiritimatiellia bacterium]
MSGSVKICCLAVVAGLTGCAQFYSGITEDVQQVATGFRFTEGPALATNGDIYFTDIHNSRIHRWSSRDGVSTYRENTGRANGLLFDRSGNLLVCEGGNRRLTSISPHGIVTVVADAYDGRKLNSPNDLWIDGSGGIYFTDPRYWKRDNLEQDGEHVYYVPPGGGKLRRVIDDLVRPNGIVGTPDGKTLYVADHGGKKTYSYRVDDEGKLSERKLFAEEGSDGMTLDGDGNLYLTTDAVLVYSPKGDLLRRIEIPEKPTNVSFGKDGRTLFVTARTSFYAVRVR